MIWILFLIRTISKGKGQTSGCLHVHSIFCLRSLGNNADSIKQLGPDEFLSSNYMYSIIWLSNHLPTIPLVCESLLEISWILDCVFKSCEFDWSKLNKIDKSHVFPLKADYEWGFVVGLCITLRLPHECLSCHVCKAQSRGNLKFSPMKMACQWEHEFSRHSL